MALRDMIGMDSAADSVAMRGIAHPHGVTADVRYNVMRDGKLVPMAVAVAERVVETVNNTVKVNIEPEVNIDAEAEKVNKRREYMRKYMAEKRKIDASPV